MGFSLRKWVALSVYVSLPLICSCDKHPLGEMPEVQRELTNKMENGSGAGPAVSPGQTPTAKPTPADFFPETKPR